MLEHTGMTSSGYVVHACGYTETLPQERLHVLIPHKYSLPLRAPPRAQYSQSRKAMIDWIHAQPNSDELLAARFEADSSSMVSRRPPANIRKAIIDPLILP